MKKNDQCVMLMTTLLSQLVSELPPSRQKQLLPTLDELKILSQDGRKSWSAERRESHSAALREVWSGKRTNEKFYLKRNGEVIELAGWNAVCKALGLKENSIKCMLSTGRGASTFKRGGEIWVLARTRELIGDAIHTKFNETGNPDDIPYVNPASKFLQRREANLRKVKK